LAKQVAKQGFQETYYIVRYQEDDISEITEKSFRSLKKANEFHDIKAGEGYRVWVETRKI
jgi:hypothetical protein